MVLFSTHNIYFGYCPIEMVLFSTHNIYFGRDKRELIYIYPLSLGRLQAFLFLERICKSKTTFYYTDKPLTLKHVKKEQYDRVTDRHDLVMKKILTHNQYYHIHIKVLLDIFPC